MGVGFGGFYLTGVGMMWGTIIRENRQLGTDEPVEFEK